MISDLPLFFFTFLTGIAAGTYLTASISPQHADRVKPWALPAVVLVLVVVGGISASMHLGRPGLAYNMVNNLASPLMIEGIAAGCLAIVAMIDVVVCATKKRSARAIRIIGAVFSALLMIAVTYAYVTSYGNPMWIAAPTYVVFILGGLTAGVPLWAVLSDTDTKGRLLATAVLSAAFACVLVWQAIVFATGEASGVALLVVGAVLAFCRRGVSLVPQVHAWSSSSSQSPLLLFPDTASTWQASSKDPGQRGRSILSGPSIFRTGCYVPVVRSGLSSSALSIGSNSSNVASMFFFLS